MDHISEIVNAHSIVILLVVVVVVVVAGNAATAHFNGGSDPRSHLNTHCITFYHFLFFLLFYVISLSIKDKNPFLPSFFYIPFSLFSLILSLILSLPLPLSLSFLLYFISFFFLYY